MFARCPEPSSCIWSLCPCHPSGLLCVALQVKQVGSMSLWEQSILAGVISILDWYWKYPSHAAKSIVWDSFNFTLEKAGIMCRSCDRNRNKWFAEDDAGGLVVKCGLWSPRSELCVRPRILARTWNYGLRIFPFALLAEESSRLTKPLKLMNFSCASRDVRLISLLSSRAGAVQLPDNDKRRELQASSLSVVCSFIPSQLPVNDGWGEQRQRAKHVQPVHPVQSCIIQVVLFPVCMCRRHFPEARTAVAGGRLAGAGAGSFGKSTSQMQMLSFIKTHLKPSVINKHKTPSQLGHAVDYGSPLFLFPLHKAVCPFACQSEINERFHKKSLVCND